MGLTSSSTGIKLIDTSLVIEKENPNEKIIALAGNPNVGKSTVFNELTGLNQHTGNWPGKTVTNATGKYTYKGIDYTLVDIPGTYSLMAHSTEEEVARDFICFGEPDVTVVVCDATCLERNLNLVLQTIEISNNVIVCLNLMDEAKRKNIKVDLKQLEMKLGVPVIPTNARNKDGLDKLMEAISNIDKYSKTHNPIKLKYTDDIENAIKILEPSVKLNNALNSRWLCLRLLENDAGIIEAINKYLGYNIKEDSVISAKLEEAKNFLNSKSIKASNLQDIIVSKIISLAENICKDCVSFNADNYNAMDRKIDRILTSKWTGIPIMLILLLIIFWITITGANYPSQVISTALFWVQDRLIEFFISIGTPKVVYEILVLGIYRVVAWVVAVMLPPMAIFFPLFTLLEDLGYLPRIAFNLDKHFKKCCACGKQALTMCMGFGCNAAGIIGCRIIDSPRERLIAIITNNFIPCNGRFPILITLITIFFVGNISGLFQGLSSALLLTAVIVLGVLMTFLVSKILSKTILKGIPSSFTLELPPFRKPQVGKIIIRSIFDRTLFVLGRAVVVAIPAGLVIWIMANVNINGITLLSYASNFLDPFARLLGLDGVILIAFILGFPANEIVIPIIIMAYMSTGSLIEIDDFVQLKALLVDNGWTWLTAICTMLFSLMHWPCSTTCLTIKKETQSLKWTLVSFAVPTIVGMTICFIFTTVVRFFNLI